MPAKRTYTDEQLAYIKRYWRKYPTKLVAEQLGMTPKQVDAVARYHGLTKNKSKARTALPEFNMVDKDWSQALERVGSIIKPVSMRSGVIKLYGMIDEPKVGLTIPSLKKLALISKPRKNWLQRALSWLLTGEV